MFKVGDTLLKNGQLFNVDKLVKTSKGDEEKTIVVYTPKFPQLRHRTLQCKIDLEMVEKVGMRLPISKSELKEEMSSISEIDFEEELPGGKGDISKDLNDFHKMFTLLVRLWHKRQVDQKELPYSKRQLFDFISTNLTQELAVIWGSTPEKAEVKLENHLKKNVEVIIPEPEEKKKKK